MDHCSLDTAALAARLAAWHDLDPAVLDRRRTPTGAAIHFRLETGVAERLLDLIGAEAACCPGVAFDATVTLTVDGPEEIAGLFAPR